MSKLCQLSALLQQVQACLPQVGLPALPAVGRRRRAAEERLEAGVGAEGIGSILRERNQ